MVFANGHTMALTYNMDSLGKLYIAIATAWTVILLMGATFLISKRELPYLRIRNIPLAISAVGTLHVYWVLCMVAYILQGHFPCAAEFWIMSIYLPLGIALFQACNTQLLHIATLQKKYTDSELPDSRNIKVEDQRGWRRYGLDLRSENSVDRTMAFIAYGMIVQVIIALFVFFVSYKFHEGFGLTAWQFSTSAEVEKCASFKIDYHVSTCTQAKKIACRKGWEWIPSILWQVVWAWCYAPYLLWQVRDVQDVHGWRKQTTLCCVFGLFATPMWLCSLYIPGMAIVNRYYVPPLWFAPSIFLIEAFLIFVPCWQVIKNHRLQTETLDIIAEWEFKNNGSSVVANLSDTTSKASWKASTSGSSSSSRRGEMYTMAALESAIRTNPQRLLLFAALKDFSGENISFLTKVLDWRRGWSPSTPTRNGFLRRPSVCEINNKDLQRQQFKSGVEIYASCISLKYSRYPINLSYVHLKELEMVFEGATVVIYGCGEHEIQSATPFDEAWHRPREHPENILSKEGLSLASTPHTSQPNDSTDHILGTVDHGKGQMILQTYEMMHMSDHLPDNVSVPRNFGPDIFDRVEESIKYMVLTNTWPKFVNTGHVDSPNKKKSIVGGIQDMFMMRKT